MKSELSILDPDDVELLFNQITNLIALAKLKDSKEKYYEIGFALDEFLGMLGKENLANIEQSSYIRAVRKIASNETT
jgi:hypothetical protein